ncbi:MAG: hypothetical protein JSU65_05950, partial [Candidatus Zixiibacteriota bacterium]
SSRYCQRIGSSLKIFEPEAREYLLDFDWPGNVRQLLDTVQSLIDLSPSYYITKAEVAGYLVQTQNPAQGDGTYANRVREFKRNLILKSLDRHGRNVSATARELSIDPSNLRKIIKDLQINLG